LAAKPEGEVKISKAYRLRIERFLDSGRLEKLRAFKTRITDWATPSPKVYDEPVIVILKKGDVERVFDHYHADVLRFEELVNRKKAAGYVVSAKDAVLAYMLVFKRGSRHLIAGFLKTFPEWSDVNPETVGQALSRLKVEGWLTG